MTSTHAVDGTVLSALESVDIAEESAPETETSIGPTTAVIGHYADPAAEADEWDEDFEIDDDLNSSTISLSSGLGVLKAAGKLAAKALGKAKTPQQLNIRQTPAEEDWEDSFEVEEHIRSRTGSGSDSSDILKEHEDAVRKQLRPLRRRRASSFNKLRHSDSSGLRRQVLEKAVKRGSLAHGSSSDMVSVCASTIVDSDEETDTADDDWESSFDDVTDPEPHDDARMGTLLSRLLDVPDSMLREFPELVNLVDAWPSVYDAFIGDADSPHAMLSLADSRAPLDECENMVSLHVLRKLARWEPRQTTGNLVRDFEHHEWDVALAIEDAAQHYESAGNTSKETSGSGVDFISTGMWKRVKVPMLHIDMGQSYLEKYKLPAEALKQFEIAIGLAYEMKTKRSVGVDIVSFLEVKCLHWIGRTLRILGNGLRAAEYLMLAKSSDANVFCLRSAIDATLELSECSRQDALPQIADAVRVIGSKVDATTFWRCMHGDRLKSWFRICLSAFEPVRVARLLLLAGNATLQWVDDIRSDPLRSKPDVLKHALAISRSYLYAAFEVSDECSLHGIVKECSVSFVRLDELEAGVDGSPVAAKLKAPQIAESSTWSIEDDGDEDWDAELAAAEDGLTNAVGTEGAGQVGTSKLSELLKGPTGGAEMVKSEEALSEELFVSKWRLDPEVNAAGGIQILSYPKPSMLYRSTILAPVKRGSHELKVTRRRMMKEAELESWLKTLVMKYMPQEQQEELSFVLAPETDILALSRSRAGSMNDDMSKLQRSLHRLENSKKVTFQVFVQQLGYLESCSPAWCDSFLRFCAGLKLTDASDQRVLWQMLNMYFSQVAMAQHSHTNAVRRVLDELDAKMEKVDLAWTLGQLGDSNPCPDRLDADEYYDCVRLFNSSLHLLRVGGKQWLQQMSSGGNAAQIHDDDMLMQMFGILKSYAPRRFSSWLSLAKCEILAHAVKQHPDSNGAQSLKKSIMSELSAVLAWTWPAVAEIVMPSPSNEVTAEPTPNVSPNLEPMKPPPQSASPLLTTIVNRRNDQLSSGRMSSPLSMVPSAVELFAWCLCILQTYELGLSPFTFQRMAVSKHRRRGRTDVRSGIFSPAVVGNEEASESEASMSEREDDDDSSSDDDDVDSGISDLAEFQALRKLPPDALDCGTDYMTRTRALDLLLMHLSPVSDIRSRVSFVLAATVLDGTLGPVILLNQVLQPPLGWRGSEQLLNVFHCQMQLAEQLLFESLYVLDNWNSPAHGSTTVDRKSDYVVRGMLSPLGYVGLSRFADVLLTNHKFKYSIVAFESVNAFYMLRHNFQKENHVLYRKLAVACHDNRDYARAAYYYDKVLRKAIREKKVNEVNYLAERLAVMHMDRGDFARAEKYLLSALGFIPPTGIRMESMLLQLRLQLAQLYLNGWNFDRGIALLQSLPLHLLSREKRNDATFTLAKTYLKKRWTIDCANVLASIDEKQLLSMGGAYNVSPSGLTRGSHDSPGVSFEDSVAKHSGEMLNPRIVEYTALAAKICFHEKKYEEALFYIRAAIYHCDKKSISVKGRYYYIKGKIYQALCRHPSYLKFPSKLSYDPYGDKESLVHKCWFLELATKELTAANRHHRSAESMSTGGRGSQHPKHARTMSASVYDGQMEFDDEFKVLNSHGDLVLQCVSIFRRAYEYFRVVDHDRYLCKTTHRISETLLSYVFPAVAFLHIPFSVASSLNRDSVSHVKDQKSAAGSYSPSFAHDQQEKGKRSGSMKDQVITCTNIERSAEVAMDIAVQTGDALLVIGGYLNFGELRFLEGRKASSLAFWNEAFYMFDRYFLDEGGAVLVAQGSPAGFVGKLLHLLRRLVRLLFCYDMDFIRSNYFIIDALLQLEVDHEQALKRDNVKLHHVHMGATGLSESDPQSSTSSGGSGGGTTSTSASTYLRTGSSMSPPNTFSGSIGTGRSRDNTPVLGRSLSHTISGRVSRHAAIYGSSPTTVSSMGSSNLGESPPTLGPMSNLDTVSTLEADPNIRVMEQVAERVWSYLYRMKNNVLEYARGDLSQQECLEKNRRCLRRIDLFMDGLRRDVSILSRCLAGGSGSRTMSSTDGSAAMSASMSDRGQRSHAPLNLAAMQLQEDPADRHGGNVEAPSDFIAPDESPDESLLKQVEAAFAESLSAGNTSTYRGRRGRLTRHSSLGLPDDIYSSFSKLKELNKSVLPRSPLSNAGDAPGSPSKNAHSAAYSVLSKSTRIRNRAVLIVQFWDLIVYYIPSSGRRFVHLFSLPDGTVEAESSGGSNRASGSSVASRASAEWIKNPMHAAPHPVERQDSKSKRPGSEDISEMAGRARRVSAMSFFSPSHFSHAHYRFLSSLIFPERFPAKSGRGDSSSGDDTDPQQLISRGALRKRLAEEMRSGVFVPGPFTFEAKEGTDEPQKPRDARAVEARSMVAKDGSPVALVECEPPLAPLVVITSYSLHGVPWELLFDASISRGFSLLYAAHHEQHQVRAALIRDSSWKKALAAVKDIAKEKQSSVIMPVYLSCTYEDLKTVQPETVEWPRKVREHCRMMTELNHWHWLESHQHMQGKGVELTGVTERAVLSAGQRYDSSAVYSRGNAMSHVPFNSPMIPGPLKKQSAQKKRWAKFAHFIDIQRLSKTPLDIITEIETVFSSGSSKFPVALFTYGDFCDVSEVVMSLVAYRLDCTLLFIPEVDFRPVCTFLAEVFSHFEKNGHFHIPKMKGKTYRPDKTHPEALQRCLEWDGFARIFLVAIDVLQRDWAVPVVMLNPPLLREHLKEALDAGISVAEVDMGTKQSSRKV